MKNQNFGKRLGFAWAGIRAAFRQESSFRIQCLAAVLVIAFLALVGAPARWWALFIMAMAAVLTTEMVNTAFETFLDYFHPEKHEALRIAKDCAAGAVLISSFAAVGIFIAFLVERFAGS